MHPKEIECPKCGSSSGKRCMTTGRSSKQKKRKLHSARKRTAKKAG